MFGKCCFREVSRGHPWALISGCATPAPAPHRALPSEDTVLLFTWPACPAPRANPVGLRSSQMGGGWDRTSPRPTSGTGAPELSGSTPRCIPNRTVCACPPKDGNQDIRLFHFFKKYFIYLRERESMNKGEGAERSGLPAQQGARSPSQGSISGP